VGDRNFRRAQACWTTPDNRNFFDTKLKQTDRLGTTVLDGIVFQSDFAVIFDPEILGGVKPFFA
jgi:hypothetical protein